MSGSDAANAQPSPRFPVASVGNVARLRRRRPGQQALGCQRVRYLRLGGALPARSDGRPGRALAVAASRSCCPTLRVQEIVNALTESTLVMAQSLTPTDEVRTGGWALDDW